MAKDKQVIHTGKAFDRMVIDAMTMEGGTIIETQLMLGHEVTDTNKQVVAGHPGSIIHGARVRRAIKRIVSRAYPRIKLVEIPADDGSESGV